MAEAGAGPTGAPPRPEPRGIGRLVRSRVFGTSATNMAIAGGAAVGGILLARGLGPEDRGVYAAVFVWMTYLLAVGEGGLNAAVVYFVSKLPDQVARITRLALGGVVRQTVVVLGAAVLVVVLLDLDDGLTGHYLLGFAALVPALLGGVFTAAVYGSDLFWWNVARALQVPVYTGGILALVLLDAVTVDRALLVYAASVSVTGLTSVVVGRRLRRRAAVEAATETTASTEVDRRALYRYALPNAAWVIPTMTNQRVDQMTLSITVAPASLGAYAVASTWAQVATPAINAIGNELLPRISAQDRTDSRTAAARTALRRAMVGGVAAGVLSALTAWPAIHLLFGSEYADAVLLSVCLAPAAWGIAVRQVAGDILRGVGSPQTAAVVEATALAVGVPVLLAAGWLSGTLAAALAMSVISSLSASIMMRRAITAVERKAPHE